MPVAEHQMPADPLLRGAWASALTVAIGNEDILARFRAETGLAWEPSIDGLGAAIDAATGADEAFVSAFVDWFNVNVWGDLAASETQPDTGPERPDQPQGREA